MNRFVLIGLFFLLALGLRAQSVSENDARKAALAWLNSISDKQRSDFNISKITVQSEESTPLLYVVHFEPEGWVMVSASETVNPILGYSQTGRIDWDNLPEQVSFWVEETSHQIKRTLEPHFIPSDQVLDEWAQIHAGIGFPKAAVATVGPLLSSKWDQGKFHNEMCPVDVTSRAGNGYVYAGCVATTLAQIMKFWSHPQIGIGSYSYVHANYGTQSANFGQTTYNWGLMPNVLSAQNSAFHSEVQKITYHAAVAVNMNFNPISSGANVPDAVDALEKYFKYSRAAFWSSRDSWHDDEEWKNLLRSEIDRGRPVFYAGYNQAKNQGHAFVLDGYTGEYFHFNWGWGGTADGNFLIDVMNPSAFNFSYNQMIVAGIYPIITESLTYPFYENFDAGEPEQVVISGKATLSSKAARTGSTGLSLGDVGFNKASTNTATLTFKVPEKATLSFWVKRNSSAGYFGNNQLATLQTSTGGQVVHTFFNGDYTDADWKQFQLDLSAYAGQELTFSIEQYLMYGAYAQYIYIDDISIVRENQNLAPFVPSQPIPANASASIPANTDLRWVGGDPNGDSVSYQVYLSKTNPPLTRIDSTTATSVLPNLEYSTKYYWKVVASDGALSTSSPIWSFTTTGSVPSISTCGVSDIAQTSAVVCGRIEALNNSRVFKQGISWSVNETDFSLTKNVKECPISENPFHATIEGLLPFTKYYARSFAISNQGSVLGNVVSFYSGAVEAVIRFDAVQALSKNSARFSGTIAQLNDTSYTARGVVWSLEPDFIPNEGVEFIEHGTWTEAGAFSVDVLDLPGVQTYYARMFVENSAGRVYADEIQFQTQSFSPILNLSTSSEVGNSPDYHGVVWEQKTFGALSDAQFELTDPDGDPITKMNVVLKVKSNSGNDILVHQPFSSEISITGLNSDSLLFEALAPVSDSVWKAVLRNTYLFNDSEMPDTLTVREVEIWIADAESQSQTATAFLKVKAINDAPVCVKPPLIEGESLFGQRLKMTPGIWIDSIDGCNLNATVAYAWQVKENELDNDSLVQVVLNETLTELVLDERFCGKWIRGVEIVFDLGCGEENEAIAKSYTSWFFVGRSSQNIAALKDTSVVFGAEVWNVERFSSASLPLEYQFSNPQVARYEPGLGIAFVQAGTTIVTILQSGNTCFQPVESIQFQLNVEKTNQTLVVTMSDTLVGNSKFIPIDIQASSGLKLDFQSLANNVAMVHGDSLEIRGEGVFDLKIEQAGDINYWPLSETRSFVVRWPLSVTSFSSVSLGVYPNPATDFFMLKFDGATQSGLLLRLYAMDGRLVQQQTVFNLNERIGLAENLSSGVYLLEIQFENKIERIKLIVSKL